MSFQPEHTETLHRYLKGTLTDAERIAFEKKMEEDPSLKEEVEMERFLNELILEKGLLDIRAQVGKDLTSEGTFPWRKAIGLSVAGALVLAGLFYMLPSKSPQTETAKNTSFIQKQDSILHDKREVTDKKESEKEKKKEVTDVVLAPRIVSKEKEEIKEEISYPSSSPAPSSKQAPVETLPAKEGKETTYKSFEATPCPVLEFKWQSTPSCGTKASGTVEVLLTSIKDGRKPYLFSLDDGDFQQESLFAELLSGVHRVTLKDANGCTSSKEVTIVSKKCIEVKDYSFHPEMENWKFPFSENENGTIKILDKSGTLVYSTSFVNGSPSEWNGKSMNGSVLETGSYLYIAHLESGEVRQGYIVILH